LPFTSYRAPSSLHSFPTRRSSDLVTMDITMPGMDGVEAMGAILAGDPKARVIMVTSHGQEAMVIRSLDAGALGYVLKPVVKERLDRKSTRLNSSHLGISYAVFCLK